MLDSDFWRGLAVEFRAMDPHMWLRADWHFFINVGEQPPPVSEWRLVGPGRHSIQLEFEALARRAGPKVHLAMDSLVGWMEALREFGLNMESNGVGAELDSNSHLIGRRYFGTISGVCHASFALCKHYESMALETERTAGVLRSSVPDAKADMRKATMEAKRRKRREAEFPERAAWLRQRLAERGWDHNDLPRHRGPDRKTALKILQGGEVRPDVLDKLAKALSFSSKAPKVTILDIPTT